MAHHDYLPCEAATTPLCDSYVAVDHCWAIPQIPEALAAVRRSVRRALDVREVGADAAESAVLVVSELITNSITHALPPASLRVKASADDVIRIEVTDGGAAARSSCPGSRLPEEHGRGSLIVSTLASRYGRQARPGRVTWWAELGCVLGSGVRVPPVPGVCAGLRAGACIDERPPADLRDVESRRRSAR
ncbi:ATP-binding protein [Streptomyces sp. SYSU K217416]